MNADMDLLTSAHQKDHIATRSVLIVSAAVTVVMDCFSRPSRTITLVCVYPHNNF